MATNASEEAGRRLLTDRIRARGTRLLGRDEECQRLEALAHELTQPPLDDIENPQRSGCQLVLIHGPLGCGKISACKDLQNKLEGEPHHFLSGRFEKDHNDDPSPSTVAVQALEHLLGDQERKTGKAISKDSKLYKHLEKSLEGEARILCHLVPSFRQFLKNEKTKDERSVRTSSTRDLIRRHSSLKGSMMKAFTQRLSVACVDFLKSFCTPEYPVVIVIDDWQFADENSLEVAMAVCQSKEITNCLFLVVYRDDETELLSPEFQNMLDVVKEDLDVHDVQFGNLNTAQVQTLVFDLLSIEADRASQEAIDLANLIDHNTLGNPYYVIQFVLSLQQRRLLQFQFATMKWNWNLDAIQNETDVADNVAAMLTSRLRSLAPSMLCFLQLASCLGYSFDIFLLEQLVENIQLWFPDTLGLDEETIQFDELMRQAQDEHLLAQSGHFSHDKLHSSVYDMVGSSRFDLHWKIGNFTKQLMEHDEEHRERFLFLAANQLIKGSSCLATEEDRRDLIQLNYEAGKVAQERNCIHLVGFFSRQAKALIRDSDWDDPQIYQVLINVHSLLAEYDSSRGDYDQAIVYSNTIMEKAKDPKDTVTALVTRIRIHFSVFNFRRAIAEARQALALCGERLPPVLIPRAEIVRAKRLIKAKSDDEILKLPEMADFVKKKSISILLLTSVCGWMTCDTSLYTVCSARMVSIVMKHGQYQLGTVLASFAAAISDLRYKGQSDSSFMEDAYHVAELALRASDPRKIRPALTLYAYNFVLHTKLPVASMIDPTLAGYRKGLELGDTFFGATCLIVYSNAYLGSGLRLDTYAADMQKYAMQLKLLGNDLMLSLLLPAMQFALNLLGQSADANTISWDVLFKLGFFNGYARPQDSGRSNRKLLYSQLFNSFVLRDVATAEATHTGLRFLTLSKQERNEMMASNSFNDYFFAFVESLSGYWLYLHGSKRSKFIYWRLAEQSFHWLRKRKNINTVPLIALLEAHKASVLQSIDVNNVVKLFNTAIVMFSRSGQTHFAAFGSEMAGEYLLRQSDVAAAQPYLARSVELYRDWAARVKVKQLVQKHEFLSVQFDNDGEDIRGKALRGRRRFRASLDAASSNNASDKTTLSENAAGIVARDLSKVPIPYPSATTAKATKNKAEQEQSNSSDDHDATAPVSERTQSSSDVSKRWRNRRPKSANDAPREGSMPRFSRLRRRRVLST